MADAETDFIISENDPILVTGANGFIGQRVVKELIDRGFSQVRCFVRSSGQIESLNRILSDAPEGSVEIINGNLLAPEDCRRAVKGVRVIYHLAAGIEKTFAGSFQNSVVTTRNLLDEALSTEKMVRFVSVSSFAVYSNLGIRRGDLLDESCPIETEPMKRYEPYCYGKLKQDHLVEQYGKERGLPYCIMRPGAVFGPGRSKLSARVGIDTFGIFLHLGGRNRIPFTYVDNCARAIVLGGLVKGVEGEVFNVVDDELPASRSFLRQYKKFGGHFRSLYIPYPLFHALCRLWERYSEWSQWQLPPAFNTRRCAAYWKGNRYTNDKLKKMTGWEPAVSYEQAARYYFESLRDERQVKI